MLEMKGDDNSGFLILTSENVDSWSCRKVLAYEYQYQTQRSLFAKPKSLSKPSPNIPNISTIPFIFLSNKIS